MDMLGGSPDVRLLPDLHSVHLWRFLSKPVSIVRCNNPRFALLFRNRLPTLENAGPSGRGRRRNLLSRRGFCGEIRFLSRPATREPA
jgi:hypothetical protein